MPDLADLLAQKARCTKKDAELFLKEFFGLASEVISKGEPLKINGLGVFKAIWVEKRASVNIQTGLPFEIPGHYKLTFIPDKNLKEAVNAPFACFEAEILPDDVMTDAALTEEEDEESEDLLDFDEDEVGVIDGDEAAMKTVTLTSHEDRDEKEKYSSSKSESVSESVNEEKNTDEKDVSLQPLQKSVQPENIDIKGEFRRRTKMGYISGFLSACLLISLLALGWLYFDKADSYKEVNLTMHPVTFTIKKNKTDVNENKDSLSVVETMVTDSIKATAVMKRKSNAVDEVVKQRSDVRDEEKYQNVDSVDLQQHQKEVEEPKIPVTEVVKPGIFLTTISLKHYGHRTFWVYIYEENKMKIKNPNNVPIGTVLVIPDPDKYGINSGNKESVDKAKALAAEILKRYEK